MQGGNQLLVLPQHIRTGAVCASALLVKRIGDVVVRAQQALVQACRDDFVIHLLNGPLFVQVSPTVAFGDMRFGVTLEDVCPSISKPRSSVKSWSKKWMSSQLCGRSGSLIQ